MLSDSKRSNESDPNNKNKRSSRVEAVSQSILESIKIGKYVPGQRLIEADLTAELSISRGPLREALRLLAARGVIDLIPNRGAIIKKIHPDDIKQRLVLIDILGAVVLKNSVLDDQIRTDLNGMIDQDVSEHPVLLITVSNFYVYLAQISKDHILEDMIHRLNIPCFARYMTPANPVDCPALWQHFKKIVTALVNGSQNEALKTHSNWMKQIISR